MGKSRNVRAPKVAISSGVNISAIANRLRGSPNRLRTVFSEIRASLPTQTYDALTASFRDRPFYKLKIFGEAFPRSPAQIKRLQPLQALSATHELRWAESVIKHYSPQLTEMGSARNRIVFAILSDHYSEAMTELDNMEREYGLSIWSYSIRFFLRSRIQGPDSNNSLYAEIRKAPGVNGYTYFILFHIGFRMSPGSTVQHVRDQVPTKSQVYESLSLYIGFKLAPLTYEKKHESDGLVEAIVRHETNSSAFDLLSTYVRALPLALARNNISWTFAGASTSRLMEKINEKNFRIIRAIAEPSSIKYDIKTADILDSLDKIIDSGLSTDDNRLDALIRALGWIGSDPTALSHQLRSNLVELARHGGNRQAAADEIERLCTTVSGLEEAICIFEIAIRFWNFPNVVSLFGSLEGIVASGCILPDAAEFIPDAEQALLFLAGLEAVYGKRPAIDLFKSMRGAEHIHLHPDVKAFASAIRLTRELRYQDALAELHAISTASTPALNIIALRARLLLASGALSAAVLTVASACLADPSAWAALPIAELTEAVIASGGVAGADLAWAALLDVATRHIDQHYARRRSYAVEDAWESRGVSSPSALAEHFQNDEKELGVHYLRYLCTSDVLSDSDQFQSVRELEEERIRVCQALVELDPESAETHLSEIKAITRWLVIYDGLRSIERSKVYVDIEGLQAHLISVSGAEYDRMLALRKERKAIGDVDDLLRNDVVQYRDDELIGNILLRYTQEDPLKIIRNILIVIFREYASNSKFGLDVYLSTRIRHGTLKGHLRSPLEENQLICQKSGGDYRDQPHWVSRMAELSENSETDLLAALKEFSQKIDDDISELNGRYLRLRSEINPDGWFDIQAIEGDIEVVNDFIEEQQPSFAHFLDVAFASLNKLLASQLIGVQVRLRVALRQRWAAHFRDLREVAQQFSSGLLRSEFDAAIATAQVSVDLAVERVASWFTLSTAKESPDYTIELAIEIAARSIDNCFGSNVLTVDPLEAEGPYLRGRTLASLVDVFFILFENVVKHSRVGSSTKADVLVSRTDRFYTVTVRNELPPGTDRSKLQSVIDSTKESLTGESEHRLVTEGGTGYHKLRKILGSDLRVDHDFDFGIGGDYYEVSIYLDAAGVMV